MADTGAPFEIPYVEPTDLVRTYPAASELLADAIADQFGLGFQFVGTRYYTSSGTFAKADPFGDSSFDGAKMRAIRVRVQGGGGGSTGSRNVANNGGSGGGGGGYAEAFITDITSLSASETVTRGAGGTGGSVASNDATDGGESSFATTLVVASGGGRGIDNGADRRGGLPGIGTAGDVLVKGSGGGYGQDTFPAGAQGGSSHLGGGAESRTGRVNGQGGGQHGGGASGGCTSTASGTDGGNGAAGIVIVDVFA